MSISHPCLKLLSLYSRVAPTERGGYRLVRLARRFIPRDEWRGRYETPDRLDLELDLGTYPDCSMAVGLYELDTYRVFRRLLRPGAWFVDCGANLGYFTLLAARWVGVTGRVDSFEPDSANRQRLISNLQRNGIAHVHVHEMAVADEVTELVLYQRSGDSANHGMTSAYVYDAQRDTPVRVQCVRLDDYLDGVPDVVKIDIEGGEIRAIKGMSRLMNSAKPPAIVFELNHDACRSAGHTPSDLVRCITAINPAYKVYWIGSRLSTIKDPSLLDNLNRDGNLLARVD